MDKTLGFIGCGNMAKAMIDGIIKSGVIDKSNIYGTARTESTLCDVKNEYGINVLNDNLELAKISDIIVLSVKPDKYDEVIREIRNDVKEDVIIVSVAAGIDIAMLEYEFKRDIRIMRTMPNTPAKVGAGMTAITCNEKLAEDEKTIKELRDIFESFGKVELIDEEMYHVATAISGSLPAYVYMFIESLADGAVLNGMSRDKAYRFIAQGIYGTAKVVSETGEHPAKLKDDVCSPGGTTISAVTKLEEKGFRNAVIAAVQACVDRSREMSE